MANTTATHETVSAEAIQNDIIFEQSGSYYGYLGQDGEGFHHHIDEATNMVYVTENRADRFLPEDAGLYWFRVRGKLDHAEELDQADRENWIAYVDSVRGWRDRPAALDITGILAETLTTRGDR